ncbi:MAG: AbrB/MazE/SpoVT family DNA-binding domain-containing protein [Candidatus Paceibacterota bacterium]
MARAPLHERNIRKLFKTGETTYALTLPIEMIRKFCWQDGQKLTVSADGDAKCLIIEDWKE